MLDGLVAIPNLSPVPVPEELVNLIAHRAEFNRIWQECLKAGMSSYEGRLYATLELQRMVKDGELKGKSLFTVSLPPAPVPSEDPTSMFYRGRLKPEDWRGTLTDKSIDDRLLANPSHAPLKIDRRPLRLKPKPEPKAPAFPFIKDKRPVATR